MVIKIHLRERQKLHLPTVKPLHFPMTQNSLFRMNQILHLLKDNRDQAQVCQSVFSQIKKIFTSNKKFYMISGEQVPAITLRKKILQMDATAFENIVNIIIEKASTINNFHAYILSLINTTVEISDLKYTAECAAAQNDINSALI